MMVETLAEMVGKLNGMVEKLYKVAYKVGEKLNGTEEAVEIGEKERRSMGEARQDGKLDEMGKNFDDISGQGFDGMYSRFV